MKESFTYVAQNRVEEKLIEALFAPSLKTRVSEFQMPATVTMIRRNIQDMEKENASSMVFAVGMRKYASDNEVFEVSDDFYSVNIRYNELSVLGPAVKGILTLQREHAGE